MSSSPRVDEHGRARTEASRAEQLFRVMSLIRSTEERLLDLFSQGELSGTTHTSIGQEAIAAAVGLNREPGDPVFSTHRCHGHFLATGGAPADLFAEIMGRRSPLCGGRGGSQHLHLGDFYSNGIQGGVVGNATGMALAEKLKGSGRVVIGFLGDGTLGEGLVYESLNFASLHDLPLLLVLEDNGYSQSTPKRLAVAGSITARAEAFDVATSRVDTDDPLEIDQLIGERLALVRGQGRPFLQVVGTYRLAPHSKGDDDRDPAEIEAWRRRDPLRQLATALEPDRAAALEREAEQAVDAALAAARGVPHPEPADAAPVDVVPPGSFPPPWPRSDETFVTALNRGLHELLEHDPSAFVIGEDLLDPYGGAFKVTKGLSTRFPERVLTTPLSEAGIVAWSTGAALRGLRPVAEIMFGDFLALAADQIVNHASKYRWIYGGDVSVPAVIRTPVGGHRGYGPTHSQSLEAMFMSVPGLAIVAPSHLLDPGELLRRCALGSRDPVLFVEHKLLYAQRLVGDGERAGEFFVRASDGAYPTLHLSLAEFQAADAAIVTYGGSVAPAMEAARTLLVEHELLCDVVAPTLVSPPPLTELARAVGRAPTVAVLEEGPRRGGWGAEIAASLADAGAGRILRLAAPDSPIPSSKQLEDQLLPSSDSIVSALVGQ
jgi:2-oxoisovalerate dehydrogenase E1 component